jgi:26S proteasome regulatory subunit (ATPase 3-interacting protein)
MNRPYGAVDVSANLKGSVPKTAAQKILASLAEKGDLVQKTYGMKALHISYTIYAEKDAYIHR